MKLSESRLLGRSRGIQPIGLRGPDFFDNGAAL